MHATKSRPSVFQELAELFARNPTAERVLRYRPSTLLQRRARLLLSKQGEGTLSFNEQRELDEFLHAEFFIRLLKAKVRIKKV